MDDDIRAPIPSRQIRLSQLNLARMKTVRSSSSSDNLDSKRSKLAPGITPLASIPRPRSATPLRNERLFNGMDSDDLLKKRLKHYNLDYVANKQEHLKQIYDPRSKWFSRDVKPKFYVEDCLPYKTETHTEQAKYLCHVLVNLYIAICSLDIQGLISISSRDLAGLKRDIDDLALNTDLFQLSNEEETSLNDIGNFDEDEDEDDSDDFDLAGPNFNATGKITAKSATIINVNHWTNELKNCMHFDIPISLRKVLASVYYSLSLVQGQKIYRQMHVDLFESLVNIDDEGTNFTKLLLESGLELDYRPMLKFLNEFLPYPEVDFSRYDISCKADLQLFRLLLKLAHLSKPFYGTKDKEILQKTIDYFTSSLAPATVSCVLPIITSFVPYSYHESSKITDYFPLMFTLWTTTDPSVVFDTHFYDFIGCISEDAYIKLIREKAPDLVTKGKLTFGEFGLLTEEQMSFIFNRIQNHLRTDFQIVSFARTVRPLIYSINGSSSDNFFSKLKGLITSIGTFAHPSNSGTWTKVIAKFIHGFIKMYHERVKLELSEKSRYRSHLNLQADSHLKMVEIFLDILVLGSQNKNSDMANYYISSFAYLLDINSENKYLIFDKIMLDLYDSLTDQYVNSVHRVIASLKQFTRIVRFMVTEPLYRVHITNILSMLVSKIDFNDISLTSNVANCIVSIVSFIPLENLVSENDYATFESNTIPFTQEHLYFLKEGQNSDTFQYDSKILDAAFRGSTTVFENILKVYIDKIFQLVDIDLEDGFTTKINQTTMIMMESMCDEIFTVFKSALERKFWENDSFKEKNPNYELVTIPLAAAVRRDREFGKNLFSSLSFHIREEIKRGAGSVRSSSEIQPRDIKLVTYLTALNDILRESHESMLVYSDELMDLLFYIFDNVTNPPLDVHTSMIVHHVLASLTVTEVVDYRLFPSSSTIPSSERWGGMQFDDRKFSKENLTFEWHVPSEDEITFAIKLLQNLVDYCINHVEDMMKSPKSDSEYSDKLKKFILIIAHALSGSSLLFDPDFNKNKSQVLPMDTYKRKLLLLKSIRDERCDSQELNIDIEQIRAENTDEEISLGTSDLSDEALDEIRITDDDFKDHDSEVILDDVDMSAVPSGVGTPEPGFHVSLEQNSAMSSSLAFRDLDIYACNYFFGMGFEQKMNHPLYLTVHEIRTRVGLFFHKMFKFFNTNFEDNTILFKILLHGLKVWFTDVGQETIFDDDPGATLDLEFLENIQNLAHLSEPYTRTCLAARAHTFHEARVLLHSTNRTPSRLETLLLKDTIKLSMSLYPNIYKPAQGCMAHAMKQLIGSYSVVMKKTVSSLKEAMDKAEYMKVEVILQILLIKKIHRKLMADYKNLKPVIDLLIKACLVKDLNVSIYADKILTDISISLKIPSSVCLLNLETLHGLEPADDSINQQIRAVRKAKEKKRGYYVSLLSQLQDDLITLLGSEQELGWKIPLFAIKLLSKLQSSFELKASTKALVGILRLTKTKHPQIVHLSIRSFLSICNKITNLADCHYDIKNVFDWNFNRDEVITLETKGGNFTETFRREMQNFDSPSFYIDSKAFVGYVAWGRELKAIMGNSPATFNVNTEDFKVLKSFGEKINQKWLLEICKILIQDNETRGVFSSSNVEFFALIVALTSNDYTNITYDSVLDLCASIYDRDDKPSMIMSVEILAGLLIGSRFTSEENLVKRDKFLDEFLNSCLDHELNQDAVDIWSILCWWVPNSVDLRRCAPLFKKIAGIKDLLDPTSDSSADQAAKLLLLKNTMATLGFRAPYVEKTLSFLVFDHPYDQVRQAVSKLFAVLIQTRANPSFGSVPELLEDTVSDSGLGRSIKHLPVYFDEQIRTLFSEIEKSRLEIIDYSPNEVLKTRYYYLASTMMYWLMEMMRSHNKVIIINYVENYIAPFLMHLLRLKEVCTLANLDPARCYVAMSFWPLRKEHTAIIVDMISEMKLSTSHELRVQLSFVEHFFSNNIQQLSEEEKEMILKFVVSNIYNESFVEVRLRAAEVLSGLIHNYSENDKIHELIIRFEKGLGNYTFKEKKELSKTDITVHSSIIGLGAVISAFPYVFPLPSWIPEQLSNLSSWARTSGISGLAAKDIISDFKKLRADTWHLDRHAFTTEQIEDFEGVLWRSYYA
ncbi:LAFE_0B06634g1_1 [Lachancea fermentati]|uniref:LAFE_0B06634g1_1 n=1 Tax=Lachancea fermentati TaxID=4955 RepID=A0A1G4M844_LACFM|nr:LAFE_0B06634g1_1 [Lachancea fermentati]